MPCGRLRLLIDGPLARMTPLPEQHEVLLLQLLQYAHAGHPRQGGGPGEQGQWEGETLCLTVENALSERESTAYQLFSPLSACTQQRIKSKALNILDEVKDTMHYQDGPKVCGGGGGVACQY